MIGARDRRDKARPVPLNAGRVWCAACEGTGDFFRHDPQPDDPYLMTRLYGVPCNVCGGEQTVPRECPHCGWDLDAHGNCTPECAAIVAEDAREQAAANGQFGVGA